MLAFLVQWVVLVLIAGSVQAQTADTFESKRNEGFTLFHQGKLGQATEQLFKAAALAPSSSKPQHWHRAARLGRLGRAGRPEHGSWPPRHGAAVTTPSAFACRLCHSAFSRQHQSVAELPPDLLPDL
jgi:hypothetical protein